jgi:hypothetical protein
MTAMEPVVLPVTEDFRRKRRMTMIVATVAIIIAVAAFAGFHSYSVKTVNILSVELTILYQNSSEKWLGPQTQFLTANYKTLDGGSIYQYSIVLKNHSSTVQYIDSITSGTNGFSIVTTGHTAPISFNPGQSITIGLLIHLPNYNFVGTLDVVITGS